MSDSEYSENLDVNAQDDCDGNRQYLQQLHNLEVQRYANNQEQQHQNANYMRYAGSTSSSAESSISSTSSEDSDDGDSEDTLELAKITTEVLSLPRGLCENATIFQEFFSLETWQELPISMQNYLQQFLPNFSSVLPSQMAAVEQTRTISMLFNNELTRFNQSPLRSLQHQLEVGNCRPDIIKLRQNILKSQRREQKFQQCERLSQAAKQLFLSRQRLLDTAFSSSPDTTLKPLAAHNSHQPKVSHLFTDNKLSAMRARKRFYCEISQIVKQLGFSDDLILSADEEDTDDREDEEMKKDCQTQQRFSEETNDSIKTTTSLADRCIYSTIFKKIPELEDEEAFRLQQKTKQSKLTNRNFREYLREHKRRKLTEPTLPEFETSDIRLRDVCARAQMGGNFKRTFAFGKTSGRKSKISAAPTITTATTIANTTSTTTPLPTTLASSITSTVKNFTISNTSISTSTATTAKQPITIKSLPPPPPTTLPPTPKLSEPPALVPIQPTLKKPETYQGVTAAPLKSPHKEYQKHSNNPNQNDHLNISQLMSVSNHADLNLCIDDSSLLTCDHNAFNMLDNEVELQQEEVETFAGACEETLPAFVIGNDMTLHSNGNETKSDLVNRRGSHMLQANQVETVISQPVPKLEPISRLTVMNQKLSNTTTSNASELIQETHACYFSLIRDFFCSTPNHRMRYDDLRHKIDVWLRNPITALNEWYSLSENWSNLLKSAINFLVGEFPDMPDEYVPYIEHKIQLNIYQWIGAGRDSDNRLSDLCTLWMQKRKQPKDQHSESNAVLNENKLEVCTSSSLENEDSREAGSDTGGGLTPPPPPPRFPTTWTVRAATQDEITEFQRQERDRFEQPHKAYTYRMHGYESVVGPVKGIYTPMLALSKARGHSMMVGDRPNFVTILTLVRDATARLPNGEGTRAEISELLKCSQYINRDASENVLQTIVSGALDRMHTEHDPCVRYDPKRKIWIYLHRNRSEEEFERIHQQNQSIGKTKKLPQRKQRPVCTNVSVSATIDNDNLSVLTDSPETSNVSSTCSIVTMPALVPSNPIIVTSNLQRQHQQVLQQQLPYSNKCPPVPPLKYNIPPSQTNSSQQQKSLLKTTVRTENKPISSFNSNISSNISKQQQHTFQAPQNKSNANNNTTPIIVATPQGLQTVHVSNATSVMSSQNNKQQSPTAQQHTNLTANLAGKRVTLNKPIIINQITQQTSPSNSNHSSYTSNQKLKSPQQLIQKSQLIQNRITLQTNQHQLLTQQQQQPNLIIPISMANNMTLNVQSSNITDQIISSSTQTSSSSSNQSPTTISNKQNIIRLVPAANVKTITSTTPQIVNRPKIVGNNSVADRTVNSQLQQQKSQSSGLQLLTNNGNVTVAGGSSNQAGSVVKMSAQQFASLQQKHGQPHLFVKQAAGSGNKTQTIMAAGNKPQRVILGNTAIVGQAGQTKNIILQQIPVASSSVVVTPTQTSAASSTTSSISGNKIQTISAKNLTPQQQRILIQNLKQQQQQQPLNQQTINQNQIQFKTVQVVGNATSTQSNVAGRKQAITVNVGTNQQATPKTIVVVSQDNGAQQQQQQIKTRILKTNPQIKSEMISSTTQGGTRVISSSGQIISLDNLIQKQGGTLRLTSTGNTQVVKTNQQIANAIQKSQQITSQQQKVKQLQTQQFAVVSVPNSIISLGSNSNLTVGQRIITTQSNSGNTTSLVTLDTTKVTPSIVSTGTGRVITATAAGTKLITKPAASSSIPPGNIRVINTVNQTGNINFATIQGKQVVLAPGKAMNTITKSQFQTQQQQQQNVVQIPQTGNIVIGGQAVKLQQGNTNIQQLLQKSGSNIVTNQSSTSNPTSSSGQLQTVIMGNQILRVQQLPQIVSTSANRLNTSNAKALSNKVDSNRSVSMSSNTPKTIFVGSTGQTLRLQPASSQQSQSLTNKNIILQSPQQNLSTTKTATIANTNTPNRVVLAVQGGGQIFLSPNFQGSNINLKSLQNMKVVSLAQQPTALKLKDATLHSTSSTASSSTLTSQQSTILKTVSTTATASDTNI